MNDRTAFALATLLTTASLVMLTTLALPAPARAAGDAEALASPERTLQRLRDDLAPLDPIARAVRLQELASGTEAGPRLAPAEVLTSLSADERSRLQSGEVVRVARGGDWLIGVPRSAGDTVLDLIEVAAPPPPSRVSRWGALGLALVFGALLLAWRVQRARVNTPRLTPLAWRPSPEPSLVTPGAGASLTPRDMTEPGSTTVDVPPSATPAWPHEPSVQTQPRPDLGVAPEQSAPVEQSAPSEESASAEEHTPAAADLPPAPTRREASGLHGLADPTPFADLPADTPMARYEDRDDEVADDPAADETQVGWLPLVEARVGSTGAEPALEDDMTDSLPLVEASDRLTAAEPVPEQPPVLWLPLVEPPAADAAAGTSMQPPAPPGEVDGDAAAPVAAGAQVASEPAMRVAPAATLRDAIAAQATADVQPTAGMGGDQRPQGAQDAGVELAGRSDDEPGLVLAELLDVAGRAPDRAWPAARPQLQRVDLAGLLRREIETVRNPGRSAAVDSVTLGLRGAMTIDFDPWLDGPVDADDRALVFAVRAMLRHALARAHRHVIVSARRDRGDAVIEVDDDGGAAWRDTGSGFGLGLPAPAGFAPAARSELSIALVLAEQVAAWHGGGSTLEESPLGGCRLTLRWPAGAANDAEAAAADAAAAGSPSPDSSGGTA